MKKFDPYIEYSQEFLSKKRNLMGRDYFSQACQDIFVLTMLENKKNGFYIEIGGADPFESNNTFLLEHKYGWNGFSIEYDKELAINYESKRFNPCMNADAMSFDIIGQLDNLNAPKQIDYLSLDIDPAENTYKALLNCPFDSYRFSVITYEHDFYSSGPKHMNLSREYLRSYGYKLVVENVKCYGRDFEDWWVDPKVIPDSISDLYTSSRIEFLEIFK